MMKPFWKYDSETKSMFLRSSLSLLNEQNEGGSSFNSQASTAMGKFENEKDISRHIKAFFDGKYGPNWHCIVGKGFATHATYEAKTSMFFYLPPLAILLYKMGSGP
ncbi:Dynll1, partial [Symbiodinium sp. KB8]